MSERFEYRVCQAQDSRVTFVNGEWAGRIPLNVDDPASSVESCSWDYLAEAGWELVAVNQQASAAKTTTQLFPKRG